MTSMRRVPLLAPQMLTAGERLQRLAWAYEQICACHVHLKMGRFPALAKQVYVARKELKRALEGRKPRRCKYVAISGQ